MIETDGSRDPDASPDERGAHARTRSLRPAGSARSSRPSPGAAPGTLVVSPEALPSEVRLIRFDADRVDEVDLASVGGDEIGATLVASLAEPGRTCWIDVCGLGDSGVLSEIGRAIGIHPMAMADIVHVPQRAKAELFDDRLLFVSQMARIGAGRAVEVEQVSFVLGPGWVASFRETPGDVFDPLRTRLRNGGTRLRRMGPDYLFHGLLDSVIDGFFPVIDELGNVLDALEDAVFTSPGRETFERIHAIRRTLLDLHRIQWRQRDALMSLLRDEALPISETVEPYLRDVHDHAFQTLDALETYREIVTGLMDLSISMTSQRTNEVMKTLTIVATIFIPLTFLTGVYGMNFEYMPELHSRLAYPLLWLAMIGIGVGLLWWFRRRGWIDSD